MKLGSYLLITDVIAISMILFLGFMPIIIDVMNELMAIILIVAMFLVSVFGIYNNLHHFILSLEKVRIDKNEEEYYLYLEKLGKIYLSPKTLIIGYWLFIATIGLFLYQGIVRPKYRIFLGDMPIEKYFLILWALWHAWVGARDYFYKRILLNKK